MANSDSRIRLSAEERDDLLIKQGMERLRRKNNALRWRVRRYIDSGEHLVYSPKKVKFILNEKVYYLYPLNVKTQGVEIQEFRSILSRE